MILLKALAIFHEAASAVPQLLHKRSIVPFDGIP
jgi:hypothetical protein